MSVPEIWLRFSYSASGPTGEVDTRPQIWQSVLEVLGRYRLIDPEQVLVTREPYRLDLEWPDVGHYGGYTLRLWEERVGSLELEFDWSGSLMEEVTETFCDDLACLAKEIAIACPSEFALAGWEGWFTGADRPNAWEALRDSLELKTIPRRPGLRHWFYLLGPERRKASRPYLSQSEALQIEPLPGGSVFLLLEYPAPFAEMLASWKLDLEFDPENNPVARRNLEQPYRRRIFPSTAAERILCGDGHVGPG